MKAAEIKSTTASSQKKGQPFFAKGGEQGFFSDRAMDTSFFRKKQNSRPVIQPKLTVGEPDDKYEKEADAVADKVVQRLAMPDELKKKEPGVQTKSLVSGITPVIQPKCEDCEQEEKLQMKDEGSPLGLQLKPIFESNAEPPDDKNNIQRKCAECEREDKIQKKSGSSGSQTTSSNIESSLNSLKGSGSSIPAHTKEQMEGSFGADFSNVRTHTDSSAVQMSKDLNAQAFTHGSDIYFNSGKFDANSNAGKHLLAHELTHTIQQSDATMPVQRLANHEGHFQSKESVQLKRIADGITPFVQTKCAACEKDELQQKSEADLVQESPIELQKKAIFESNGEPPDDKNNIQRKCAEFGQAEQVQTNSHSSSETTAPLVQLNVLARAQRMIQRRVIDPHKVMDDIFNGGLGRNYLKVPFKYWPAYNDKSWFDRFTDFLKLCIIDPDAIDEKHLVYMALLYSTLPKKAPDWHDAVFQMNSTDHLGGQLNVQFKLPKDASGEMGVSIYFSNTTDHVQLDSTTKVKSSAFDPLSALSFTIPNTDIANLQQSYNYNVTEGAYKGNGANFHMTYVLFTSRDPLKLQTIYFNERIEFSLVSKEKLELQFNGKFDIPSHLAIDLKQFGQLDERLPELFKNSLNLDSSLGGTHSAGGEIETLVMGFTDDKKKLVSLQAIADPASDFFENARSFTYKLLILLEEFRMGRALITEGEPPIHLTYKSLKDAQVAATRADSPGYIIVQEGAKFTIYFLTSTDLAWLAKTLRGEETAKLLRYSGIDPSQIVDLDFFGHGAAKTLADRRIMLKASYFSSAKEVEEKKPFYYFLMHRLPDGYYGAYYVDEKSASNSWKRFDNANGIINMTVAGEELDILALSVRTDEKGLAHRLKIDKEHYEGRKKFGDLYSAVEKAKDQSEISTALEKFNDPQLLLYLEDEVLRPKSMNPDQLFKQALQQLQGFGGVALVKTIGDRVFGWVAGLAETKGLEMMEAMLSFMDLLVENDMMMKAMLLTFKGREEAEKKEIIGLFTDGDYQASLLTAILEKDETMNEFVMGNTINGMSLNLVAENLKNSRDELKGDIDTRKGWLEKGTLRYENSFIVQSGELGNTIREYVYDVFGFDLDPKAFPHTDQTDKWFPSPLKEHVPSRTNLMEQIYINMAIDTVNTFKTLKTIQGVAMVVSVFSLARGAGLWAVARAGIAKATLKAFLLEALVTSIVAGVMLEGIQVALGKKFSWKDLGISIGEAFIMTLAFGWINKLFKLPITRFTINAAGFIGIGIGHYYLQHKKLPTGFDLALIVTESILTMTLLHIGTKITDPFFRKVLSKYNVDPELKLINDGLQKTVKEIAVEAGKTAPDKGRMRQLGEQYMEFIKQYREWLLKNKSKFSQEEIDAELSKLNELEGHWIDAKFVDATGLVKVAQTETTFYYRPGADSIKALKEKYGEENVQIDEKSGLGAIKTPEGTVKLIPEDVAGKGTDPTVDGKSIIEFLGNSVRKIDFGVYAFGKGHLDAIKKDVLKKPDGKWEDLGDGTYSAMIGGRRVIFIEEGAIATLDQAIAMETKVKGTGMEYLSNVLSESALKGIEILKQGPLKGMSDAEVLIYLKQVGKGIQEKNYPSAPDGEPLKRKPQSVQEYLEGVYESQKGKVPKPGPEDTTSKTFEQRLAEIWKKAFPPRMNDCIKKLRKLGVHENTILEIIRLAANDLNPNLFFGNLNTFLKNALKVIGEKSFAVILEGLSNPNRFRPAKLLMTAFANGQYIAGITDVLTLEDVANIYDRAAFAKDADFIIDLKKMVDRVNGTRDDIFTLMDEAGPGSDGFTKLNKALDRLGEGKFTPKEIRDSLAFGVRLDEAISAGSDEAAKTIFGKHVTGKTTGKFEVAESLKDTKPGDRASKFVRDHMSEIVDKILEPGGKEVDLIKWGVIKDAIEKTDLPTIVKNDIIGEIWASAKVQAYKNQGYVVVREVHIMILGADGKPTGRFAKLDAVLIKGIEMLYKEFKASDTAELSAKQQEVYDKLKSNDTKDLEPFGDKAEQAFGKGMTKFKAQTVEIERPK